MQSHSCIHRHPSSADFTDPCFPLLCFATCGPPSARFSCRWLHLKPFCPMCKQPALGPKQPAREGGAPASR
eukprot:6187317-Pleurochrysis_carterae.AAC.1